MQNLEAHFTRARGGKGWHR